MTMCIPFEILGKLTDDQIADIEDQAVFKVGSNIATRGEVKTDEETGEKYTIVKIKFFNTPGKSYESDIADSKQSLTFKLGMSGYQIRQPRQK